MPGEADGGRLDADDARATATWARGAAWLVVDHPGANEAWAAIVRSADPGLRLLVVDDHQRRDWADLRLAPTQSDAPRTLAGPEWMPIDPAFAAGRGSRPRTGIVVYFSIGDPLGLSLRAVRALLPVAGSTPLTVVCNDEAAKRTGLDGLLATWPGGARRLSAVPRAAMPGLLAGAAAVLCSASTIAWEALACGTPVAAVGWIDNQAASAAMLAALSVPVSHEPESLASVVAGLPGSDAPLFAGDGVSRLADYITDGG
jgi:spore coat polysaccharide biosynthesis predicted glycosyltransferase SpsG